jgi:hypothetical protein
VIVRLDDCIVTRFCDDIDILHFGFGFLLFGLLVFFWFVFSLVLTFLLLNSFVFFFSLLFVVIIGLFGFYVLYVVEIFFLRVREIISLVPCRPFCHFR